MIQCYHKACDNVDVMLTEENVAFLGQTVDSLVATIDKLSNSKHPGRQSLLTATVNLLVYPDV